MRILDVIHLTWIDSETVTGWSEVIDLKYTLKEIHSVGLLIHEDEEKFVVAVSYDEETDSANGIMYIPKCAVRKAETLCTIATR